MTQDPVDEPTIYEVRKVFVTSLKVAGIFTSCVHLVIMSVVSNMTAVVFEIEKH